MGLIDHYEGFDWDEGNVWKNWEKHHVAPYETEQALRNEPFLEHDSINYFGPEKRRVVKSRTDAGRYLFIVYTERKGRLRPICTRDMNKTEKKQYDEHNQSNS